MKIKGAMAKEVLRKFLHFLLGIFVVIAGLTLRDKIELKLVMMVLFIILLILIIIEYFRIEFKLEIPIYSHFIREKEADRFNGLTYGLIGTILAFTFFPFEIALAAVSMAIFGDAIACLIGKHIGGPKLFKKKTMIGSAAAFIINIIVGVVLLSNIIIVIVMALVSTFVELSVDKIEDNLVVPLFAGLAGVIAMYLINFI
jgi:dolichol kinase